MSVSDSDTPTQSQDLDRVDGQPNKAAASITYGCPVCRNEFNRVQERDRHVETYLPHSILCPSQGCTWSGRRQWDLKEHKRKKHSETGQVTVEDAIGLYDPREFVNMIFEGKPVNEVGRSAFTMAQECLERLGRSANVRGRKRN